MLDSGVAPFLSQKNCTLTRPYLSLTIEELPALSVTIAPNEYVPWARGDVNV